MQKESNHGMGCRTSTKKRGREDGAARRRARESTHMWKSLPNAAVEKQLFPLLPPSATRGEFQSQDTFEGLGVVKR